MPDTDRLAPLRCAADTHGQLYPARKQEWLLVDGLGGFACGTVCGLATRRYHALQVAAVNPPTGRFVLLSRLAEVLWVGDKRIDLSMAAFNGELFGDGAKLLRRFEIDGEIARWHLELGSTRITKELLVGWKRGVTGVRYRVEPGPEHRDETLRLELIPLAAMRDFHAAQARGDCAMNTSAGERQVTVTCDELTLGIHAGSGRFERDPDWWRNHTWTIEASRGLDDVEDLFTPGKFSFDVDGDTSATVWVTADEPKVFDWDELATERQKALADVDLPTPLQRHLARAAADFVVDRKLKGGESGGAGSTVIAGYPWFADWGRDTFIALPGLLLTTKKYDVAKQVLTTFAQHVSEGMIPNRFDDYSDEPLYNTVDASLWFIQASFDYAKASGDTATLDAILRPACEKIVHGYRHGTRFNIGVSPHDGLVFAGDESTQLTWMDAKRDDTVFTPRHGKAVEINALWYNALVHLGDDDADRVKESFNDLFVRGDGLGLYDVVTGGEPDEAIRPNQIFAVSLPHSALDADRQKSVVDVVRRKLLSPMGLRTLAEEDEQFEPRFEGEMFDRDRAYHNGTVWPWLIGAFLEAYLKVEGDSDVAKRQTADWLRPLVDHFYNAECLGSISEVFDATWPQRPAGCFAQAWSVAEVLRIAAKIGM